MSGLFNIATPHRNDFKDKIQDRSDMGVSFGDVESFEEPAPKDRRRQPLATRSDNPRKIGEFTPLLRTATKKNRIMGFETPGNHNETSESINENSGLTPISWQRGPSAIEKVNDSVSISGNGSPVQSEIIDNGGIREQEKAMDKMKKENWELKLKLFLMEKQMHQSSPEHVQLALKENIDYKVQVSSLSRDVAQYKRALEETTRKVASLGDQVSASISQEICQLPHGMSEDDRAVLDRLANEKNNLLEEQEDAEMRIRELEDEIEKLGADIQSSKDLESQIDALKTRLEESERAAEDLEVAREQQAQLQEELETVKEDFELLKSSHEDLLSQTRSADNDEVVELLREQLNEKADLIKELTTKVRNSDKIAQSAESRNESLTNHLNDLEQRNDNLEAEIEALQASLDSAVTEKDTFELQLANSEMQNAALTDKIKAYELQIASKTSEIEELRHEVRERLEDIEEFRGAADDRSREYRMLEERIEQQNHSALQHQISAIEQMGDELSEARMTIREHKRENASLRTKIDTLGANLSIAGSCLTSKRSYTDQIIEDCEAKRSSEVQMLEDKISQQASQIQTLERESGALRQRVAHSTARSEVLEAEIRSLEASDDIDSTQIQDRLRADNAALLEQIDGLQTQLRDREDDLDVMNEETSRLNTALGQIKQNSTSQNSSLELAYQQLQQTRQQLEETNLQLRSSNDKIIMLEEVRARLQHDVTDARRLCEERQEKAEALNTSLVNVRTMLTETQSAHRLELNAINKAHSTECAALSSEHADLESKLSAQTRTLQQASSDAEVARVSLQRELVLCQNQIMSMESTIQRLSENEETLNVDQARFKDALQSEMDRHQIREKALQAQLSEAEGSREKLKMEVNTTSRELHVLRDDLRAVRTNEASKIQEVALLKRQVQDVEQQLSTYVTEVRDLEAAREASIKQIANCESKIATLENTLSAARRDHQEQLLTKSDELFASSQIARELTDQLQASKSKVASGDAERKRLSLALNASEQRLIHSTERAAALSTEKEALEAKLEPFAGQEIPEQADETLQTKLRKDLLLTKEKLDVVQVEIEEVAAERDLLLDQLDEALAELDTHRSEATSTIKNLRDELCALQASLTRECERGNTLETQIASTAQSESSKAMAEQRRSTLKIDNLEESLKVVKQKHTDLLSSISTSNLEVDDLKKSIRERDREIQALKATSSQTLAEEGFNAETEKLVIELEDQLDESEARLREERDRHLKDLAKVEAERSDLTKELELTKDSLVHLQRQQDSLQSVVSQHLQTIENLALELQNTKRHNPNHKIEDSRKTERLQRELDDLKRQLHSAKREIEQLRSTAKTLETTGSRDRHAEAQSSAQVQDLSRKIKKLEAEVEHRGKKMNDLRSANHGNIELVATLERRYKTLQSQIQNNAQARPHSTSSHKELEVLRKKHTDEIAGLGKLLRYMRSRKDREEQFRADLSHIKSYYDKQITSFQACNQANLAIIRQIGIYPDDSFRQRRPTLKSVSNLVLATVRMRRAARAWAVEAADKVKLDAAMKSRKVRA